MSQINFVLHLSTETCRKLIAYIPDTVTGPLTVKVLGWLSTTGSQSVMLSHSYLHTATQSYTGSHVTYNGHTVNTKAFPKLSWRAHLTILRVAMIHSPSLLYCHIKIPDWPTRGYNVWPLQQIKTAKDQFKFAFQISDSEISRNSGRVGDLWLSGLLNKNHVKLRNTNSITFLSNLDRVYLILSVWKIYVKGTNMKYSCKISTNFTWF